MTLPEGTRPHRTSLARCFLFDIAEKVKHRRPPVRFSRETVRAARVTSGHCPTLLVREQNLGRCTRIPQARNTSRGITQDSKRGQRGPRDHHISLSVRPTSPPSFRNSSHRFSPSQFLFSSWTRFAFLRSLSWLLRCIAPHSQSCLVDLSSVHALWKVRISVVCSHLQQFFVQAHASISVDLPAFNILHTCHKNRSSHRSPQSLPTSKPPPPKWARDIFFHHSGSSPLLPTCRHVEVSAVDFPRRSDRLFFFKTRQAVHTPRFFSWSSCCSRCAEIAACVLFPFLGGLRNISLTIGDFKSNESLVNVLRSSRPIFTLPSSQIVSVEQKRADEHRNSRGTAPWPSL